jgi:hypothetical protein
MQAAASAARALKVPQASRALVALSIATGKPY